MKPPRDAETIEMIDGRIFFSRDNWRTTYVTKPGSDRARKVPRRQADLVRFLAVSQSSWRGDAF